MRLRTKVIWIIINIIIVLGSLSIVSAASCINPSTQPITENTDICRGTFKIDNPITITTDNLTLTCFDTILIGSTSGYGIVVLGNGVTIRGCTLQFYETGIIYAAEKPVVQGVTFEHVSRNIAPLPDNLRKYYPIAQKVQGFTPIQSSIPDALPTVEPFDSDPNLRAIPYKLKTQALDNKSPNHARDEDMPIVAILVRTNEDFALLFVLITVFIALLIVGFYWIIK